MSNSPRDSIYQAIASIRLIDPHTHINPHAPASSTLADLLGYHYYTELAHSAGMPKDDIEEDGVAPRELVGRLVRNLSPIENTAQYRWLVEICRMFFGFDGDRIDETNWEQVYDSAEQQMRIAEWPQMVLDQSNVEAVFLTNDFDDALTGFDPNIYIPCLRTDELVFHLSKLPTRQRLAACSGIELDGSLQSLRESLRQRFEHFVMSGARACAISLPPSFEPAPVSDGRPATALDQVLRKGQLADQSHQTALSRRVFWTIAELCDEYGLPFDLMIGVNRGVYPDGVYQGQDLYDSRVSLIQYRELFNSFPHLKFPVSVLASVTNQELVSYAWIFPNVITNGHWWYSNTPSFIARDAAARLEAVPQTKQIAYYSDAYKLEFVWPKFDMYRRILAGILAEHFVKDCRWSEERAIELGRQILRDNVDEVFARPPVPAATRQEDPHATVIDPADGTSASLAAGAIGMVPVHDEAATVEDIDSSTVLSETNTPTVLEELGNGESTRIDERGRSPGGKDQPLPDLPTKLDLEDTVRINESADDQESMAKSDGDFDLDPLPSDEEIGDADVDDVVLEEFASENVLTDAEAIEAEADPEPLDVGNLLDDESSASSDSKIRMLRGEDSFEPDEASLKLQPHPLTGELTFPVPGSGDEQPSLPESGDSEDSPDSDIDSWDGGLILDAAEDTGDDDEIGSQGETIEFADIDLDADDSVAESQEDQNDSDDFFRS